MKIERKGPAVHLELDGSELALLRLALERALFIDTPVGRQGDILAFCTRALEQLPPADAR